MKVSAGVGAPGTPGRFLDHGGECPSDGQAGSPGILPNHHATAATINTVISEPAAIALAEGGGVTVIPTMVNPRATAPRAHTPRFLPRDIGARGRYNHIDAPASAPQGKPSNDVGRENSHLR